MATLAPDFSLLIVPVIVELSKLIVKPELLSTTKFPTTFWFFKFKVTTPPLVPVVPHADVPLVSKNMLEP